MRIKSVFIATIFLLVTGTAYCSEPQAIFRPDVVNFINDRESCDHFRSEPRDFDESYKRANGKQAEIEEAERAAFLEEMTKQTCGQLDNRLRALIKKHRGNKLIANKLAEYEFLEVGSGYVYLHKDYPNGKLIMEKLRAKGFSSSDLHLMEGVDRHGLNWNTLLPAKLTIQIGYMVDVFTAQLAIETLLEYGPKDIGVVVLPEDHHMGLGLTMLIGSNPIGNNYVYTGSSIQKLLVPDLTKEVFRSFVKQREIDPLAACSKEMATCNNRENGCVSLRVISDSTLTCDAKCQAAILEKLLAASIPFRDHRITPAGRPFNCVGYRKDIDGTEEGAKCLANFLGLEYSLFGCNEDGMPYTVKIH